MKKLPLKTGIAVCLSSILMTSTVWGAGLSLRYNSKNYNYTGKQLSFTYKGKSVSLGKSPGIQIHKVNMLPYYSAIVKNGPKVKRSYNSKTGRLKLTYGKKNIIFYKNKKYAYTNGKKRKLTTAPLTVKYRKIKKSYILVPANFTAKYLGISYTYDSKKRIIHYAKPAASSTTTSSTPSSGSTYNVGLTRSSYIKEQQKVYGSYGGKTITASQYDTYINPTADTTGGFQFLTLDTYRNVNTTTYKSNLASMIAGKSGSVFSGKGDTFINAARTRNIDPLYFLCQTVHESGYGTSTLAKGIKSSSLVDNTVKKYDSTSLKGKIVTGDSVKKDAFGEITGFNFIASSKRKSGRSYVKTSSGYLEVTTLSAEEQKKTCYNLYGIKAIDAAPQLCGFTYAYNAGWTSIDAAINGAADYVSKWYVHNTSYNQNTLYKFRYNPVVANIWHQYATDPAYAKGIGELMNKYKNVYASGVSLTYTRPTYN